MARFDDEAGSVSEGWRDPVALRPEAALKRLVARAAAGVGGCDMAAITLVRNGRVIPVVSSADVARELDVVQCRAGEGPSLDAIRQLQVFHVSPANDAPSWPRFSEAAAARGIASSLSVPVTHRGEALGAMNFYARSVDAFAGCEADGLVFAAEAGAVLSASGAPASVMVLRPGREPLLFPSTPLEGAQLA